MAGPEVDISSMNGTVELQSWMHGLYISNF
jgi:hypothetical protein